MVNILKFSFLTFAARFKFWNLILLSLFILRHFQKVLKTFLGCCIVWYEMFTAALQWLRFRLADQSMTFSTSSVKRRRQMWSKCWLLFWTLSSFPHSVIKAKHSTEQPCIFSKPWGLVLKRYNACTNFHMFSQELSIYSKLKQSSRHVCGKENTKDSPWPEETGKYMSFVF